MAGRLSARTLGAASLAAAALCLSRAVVHAQEVCPDTSSAPAATVDAGYGRDADGDGVPDEVASCLSKEHAFGRDPLCYLSLGFVPTALAWTPEHAGSFWEEHGCTPALAFPVDDHAQNLGQGIVIVGASEDTARNVRDSLSEDSLSWVSAFAPGIRPSDSRLPPDRATCLVSFDYAASPTCAVAITSHRVATFYAQFCPSGLCNTLQTSSEIWPQDGLGLARSRNFEVWHVRRSIVDGATSDLDRFAFSRGVMYARDLADNGTRSTGCAAARAVPVDFSAMKTFDPTSGPPRFRRPVQCPEASDAGVSAEAITAGITLLSPALDAVLLEDASARREAVSGTPFRLLEGVPYGLIADVRADATTSGAQSSPLAAAYLLGNRALLATTAGDQPTFVVVPDSIASLDQQLVFDADSQRPVVRALLPLAAAVRAPVQSHPEVERTSQEFRIEDGATRSIEALESTSYTTPAWPPRAATFDVSAAYGTRWTSNDGELDCFATTALATPDDAYLRFAYPAASGASDEIAPGYCPNELNGWLARTAPNREGDQPLCADADDAMKPDAETAVVAEAIAECVAHPPKLDAGMSKLEAGMPTIDAGELDEVRACLRSGCDPLQPGSCPGNPHCYDLFQRLATPSDAIEKCIANEGLSGTEALLSAPKHWADITDDGRAQMISVVEMVRTTDAVSEKAVPLQVKDAGTETELPPTITSHMTQSDAFFGGAHQTPDWNWIVDKEEIAAIDPAYRGVAVINGKFFDLENELEMGVPAGMWDTQVQLPEGHKFNTHGVANFASFLGSEDDVQKLGQIWPSDFCNRFGIARGGKGEHEPASSIPVAQCSPCISCDPDGDPGAGCQVGRSFFRAHLGRGIFTPITAETVAGGEDRDTAFMATSEEWPGCTIGDAGAPKETPVSLDLQDWGECPHRITFLGKPILDCGHEGDCSTDHRLEIHPPHVITMELRQKAMGSAACAEPAACTKAAPTPGCTPGVVSAVFGWANAVAGRVLEFDLWPPPRPPGEAPLCVLGLDCHKTSADMGVVTKLGVRIVRTPDPKTCAAAPDPIHTDPSLVCTRVPIKDPNHLHCVYRDPLAETCSDTNMQVHGPQDQLVYGNPRMTPYFATSIFEARIFMGWGECKASEEDLACED